MGEGRWGGGGVREGQICIRPAQQWLKLLKAFTTFPISFVQKSGAAMATAATDVQMSLGPVCFSDSSYVVYHVNQYD